jgi:moderate conductance mechanosensitive channel
VDVRKGYQSLVTFAVFMVGLLGGFPAVAQSAATASSSASATSQPSQADRDLAWLIAVLQDDTRRNALFDKLKADDAGFADQTAAQPAAMSAEPANEPEAASLVEALSRRVSDISERALRLTASIGEVPQMIAGIASQFNDPGIRAARINIIAHVVGALLVGLVLEWIAGRLFSPFQGRFEKSAPATIVGRVLGLIVRAVLDAIPVAIFVIGTVTVFEILKESHRAELATILLVYAHVAVRSALILARILVAPGVPNLRLFSMTEETAQYLYIWIRRLAVVAVYGTFFAEAERFFGVSAAARLGFTKGVGAVVSLLLVIFVLQNRTTVARLIANERGGPLLGVRKALADVWHILAILYLVGLFGVWLFNVRGGFEYLGRASIGTIFVFIFTWALIGAMKRIVARSFQIGPDLDRRFPGLEARANRYLPIFREGLRAVVWAFALLLILQVWGVHSLQWLNSQAGVRVVGTAIAVALVLLVALVIWEGFAMALERYTARLVTRGSSGARARTLLPLFRTSAFIVLAVMSGLIMLTQIGINITPLLAGAGVVGLAVGFGSQKLVQDVINGIFILIEDTIAVGDTVDLAGGHVGVVEGISIRTIRLRDGNGGVHTVPFSEVKTVNNMTRDFAKGLFEVEVAYKEDIERVIVAMQEVGDTISKDKTFTSVVLEPFSIIGVDKVKGSGVVVLAQITTLPGKQWDVTRAFNRALKRKFDEIGVQMPTGRTTIYVQGPGIDKKGADGDIEGDADKKSGSEKTKS